MEIIPAIMPKDFDELTAKAVMVRPFVKTIQVDIMDGKLTHPMSWPYFVGQEESFEKVASGEIGLPFWKEIDYEADLMIKKPEESFEAWVNAGFHRIIVHIESTSKMRMILEEWKGVVEIGIAIGIETAIEDIHPFLLDGGVDFVQCMGIATIGHQGSPLDERVIDKISILRKTYPHAIISVDGGVKFDNAGMLLSAGANRLVSGSVIFESFDPETAIKNFQKLDTEKNGEKSIAPKENTNHAGISS